jgi:hypothetical protein
MSTLEPVAVPEKISPDMEHDGQAPPQEEDRRG